jgi:RHS repeat-associated protein
MNRTINIFSLLLLLLFLTSTIVSAAEKVYYYHTDPAGTPLAMTDSRGNVIWKADYRPFGEEQSVTGTAENNRKFVGKEKDTESGLSYFGARYLKSDVGRFISPDSVGAVDPWTGKENLVILHNPQRLNQYAYGLNNPYRYVDADGKFPWIVIPIATAIFAADMAQPQTMGSPVRDSFIDQHAMDLLLAPVGIENIGVGLAVGMAKSATSRTVAQLGSKLEYFFGKATGSLHNIDRSKSMLAQLERIGLHDTPASRQYFTEHLTTVLNNPSSIAMQSNGRVVRESLLTGPNGCVKLETVWEGSKLITGKILGRGPDKIFGGM